MRLLLPILLSLPLLGLAQEKTSPAPLHLQIELGYLLYNPRQEPPFYTSTTQADLMVHYYVIPQAGIGLGAGIAVFEAGYLFPFYLDLRGDLFPNKRISPYYYAQGGFLLEGFPEGTGLVGGEWRTNYEAQGDFNYAFGLGIRVQTQAGFDWVFSGGVRTLHLTETDRWDWNNQTNRIRLNMQRITLTAGLRF